LLLQALSHSSYVNEHKAAVSGSNERLEFLGDAVLELVSSRHLYLAYPSLPEGDLTKLRASLVCEPTLAMCARQIGLPAYLLLGKGEESTGGRRRNSIVSDALEALIGAIYLDRGIDEADAFIKKFILNDIEHKKLFYDSKTILQEVIQRDFPGEALVYRVTAEEGPSHDKHFEIEVSLGSQALGKGCAGTKKGAEMEAAYKALIELKQRGIHVS
jgi:ribonuclease-3